MFIYFDEDGSYLAWAQRHRHGYVLDWRRKPTRMTPVFHRASGSEIRTAKSKKTHWTTGRRLKACALNIDELMRWAHDESGVAPACCEKCEPQTETLPARGSSHITKLGCDILDFVLEAAVIHLDHGDADYELTVADIAGAVEKTPGQIKAALFRLVEDGYLRFNVDQSLEQTLPDKRQVYPAAKALRTLSAFAEMSQTQIETELAGLTTAHH